jgi:hypothetical protein
MGFVHSLASVTENARCVQLQAAMLTFEAKSLFWRLFVQPSVEKLLTTVAVAKRNDSGSPMVGQLLENAHSFTAS